MSLQALQQLGLSATESDLYELLLKLGEVPAAEIIAKSGFKRPTVYKALYSLEKKGLVSQKDIKKKIHFKPESPALLFEQADIKFKETEQTRNILQAILPQLLSDYTHSVERPTVQIYEGIEGLKKIYMDTLKEEKLIYSFLQTAEVNQQLYAWLTTEYIKKRVGKKIHAKVIVATGRWSKEYIQKDITELRTTKIIDSKRFPIQHEVMIYGNKVAFVNFKKGEVPIGVIINHPQISITMKAIFDLGWEAASIKF